MNEVELLTTEELITELVTRKTFLGIIICSDDEVKGHKSTHKHFCLHASKIFTGEEIVDLLNQTSGKFEEALKGEEG